MKEPKDSKVCNRCKEDLPLCCFYPKRVKGYQYYQLHCKACNSEYQREYRASRKSKTHLVQLFGRSCVVGDQHIALIESLERGKE